MESTYFSVGSGEQGVIMKSGFDAGIMQVAATIMKDSVRVLHRLGRFYVHM